jgi:hypothetical protein
VLNLSLRLNAICLKLKDELKDTLYISLFKNGTLNSEAFTCYIRSVSLDDMLNYKLSKAYLLFNLAIASSLLVKWANNSINGGLLVLIKFIVFKDG